jgi:DNA topoisomerase-3
LEKPPIAFKTTGKVILQKDGALFLRIPTQRKEEDLLPDFIKGEKDTPTLVLEKETKAPNQFTEATLLRAMETAGKQVTMKIYAN